MFHVVLHSSLSSLCTNVFNISYFIFVQMLIVGGIDRVYEIGRQFRNEGNQRNETQVVHTFVQSSNTKMAAGLFEILPSSRVILHFSVMVEILTYSS